MRDRATITALLCALLTVAATTWVATGGMAGAASTATTTVSVTVASATSLNAAGCASGTANVTDFGTVLPATSNVTSADCAVVFGSSNDTSMLRAYQTDTSGTALFGTSTGALDTTFDGDGKQTTAILAGTDEAYAVTMQPDGKILVAGLAHNGTNDDFAVARYSSNGSLDATFDGDGKQTTAVLASIDQARGVAVQDDGKIVLAGNAYNGATPDFALVRYSAAGALDASFDTDGKLTTAILAGADAATAVAIQADGKIVAAGLANNGADNDFAVARYLTSGALDTSFDGDGKVTTAIGGGTDDGMTMAIQPDGKIVVAGYANSGFDIFAIARYNTNGSLDTSFDTDGKQTTAVLSGNARASGIVIQPDGKIVIGGYAHNGTNNDFALVRYNANGSLDTTFDGDGIQTSGILSGHDLGVGMAAQQDGKVVMSGYAHTGADYDFAVARFLSNGALDSTFDGDGKQTTPVLAGSDFGAAVTVQADGKIVAVGYSGADFALVRYGGGIAVTDWAGSWGAANLFGACLHTVANATNTWTLAGSGNCTTAIDANWNALPTTASKIAWAGSGVTNATANLRYGFKATANQQAGTYVAPLTFEVVAPNA